MYAPCSRILPPSVFGQGTRTRRSASDATLSRSPRSIEYKLHEIIARPHNNPAPLSTRVAILKFERGRERSETRCGDPVTARTY
ncbi:unnamed protein product, partial [Iphiclides podalirius]